MTKRTISLDDGTKSTFDELQAQLGAPPATEASSRLIEGCRRAQAERTIADSHITGMERVSGRLEDARRNVVSKQVVSGITIHTIIKDCGDCDFTSLATAVMLPNGLLDMHDVDNGFRRRVMSIPFLTDFAEGSDDGRNVKLSSVLVRDPAAMSRLATLGVWGAQRLVAHNRYTWIPDIEAMLDEVALEGDSVGAWAHDEQIDYTRDVWGKVVVEVYRSFRD